MDPLAVPRRQRRKEARPTELTAAALDLFVEKGFAATRLEDVASRAGVSKGTLYLYFDSKEALFKAVILEGIVPVLERGESIVAAHTGSSSEALRQLVLNWWQMIGGTKLAGVPKLMISEARNFPEVAQFYYDNVISRGRRLLRGVLEQGIQRGEFRPMNVDTCIDVVMAPPMMLAIWRCSMSACHCAHSSPEDFLEMHLNLILKGLLS